MLYKGIKVNYTRKLNHFAIFFLPTVMGMVFVYQASLSTRVIGLIFAICSLGIFIKPLRAQSKILDTMFLSFDRPEDLPHTLLWLETHYIAAAIIIIPLMIYLDAPHTELALIPLRINGLGNGLAEPIGVRFCCKNYCVRTLFSDKR